MDSFQVLFDQVDFMDALTRLQMATFCAQQENDLPDSLAMRLFKFVERSKNLQPRHHKLEGLIELLIEQLGLYDTYGQTGYIGMGVDSLILEATILRAEEALADISPTFRE